MRRKPQHGFLHSSIPTAMTDWLWPVVQGPVLVSKAWAGFTWLQTPSVCLVVECPFFSDTLWRLMWDSRPTRPCLYPLFPPQLLHHFPATIDPILPLPGTQTRSPDTHDCAQASVPKGDDQQTAPSFASQRASPHHCPLAPPWSWAVVWRQSRFIHTKLSTKSICKPGPFSLYHLGIVKIPQCHKRKLRSIGNPIKRDRWFGALGHLCP